MKTFFSKSIYKNLLIVITSRKQVGERRVLFCFCCCFFIVYLSTLLEFSSHLLALSFCFLKKVSGDYPVELLAIISYFYFLPLLAIFKKT